MGSNQSFRYSLTFNKDSTNILNDRNSRNLAKILSKTIVFGERKLMKLDRSVVTTITNINLLINALDCELDFVKFNEKSEVFKNYVMKSFYKSKQASMI